MHFHSDELHDAELLFRMIHGDESAYRLLFRRHEGRAYAVALSLVRSTCDAEEVVASAFLELWRKRQTVRLVDDSVFPWIITVISFMAKNTIRGRSRYRRLLSRLPLAEDSPDHADEVLRTLELSQISDGVRAALDRMNARDASILLLCVVQERSTADAALVLGIPEGTVKSRLSRAKSKLRAELAVSPLLVEVFHE